MKRPYFCVRCYEHFLWGRWRYWWSRGKHKKDCGPIIREQY